MVLSDTIMINLQFSEYNLIMDIFVIMIEFNVDLKKNLQNWFKPIKKNYMSTTKTRMFAEACLLTGTSD